ncbi:LOW QUALITY PROTEIN: hypothetical protein PHMEG_0002478 [Phytophthora megakarya]|uniref:Uncharacterized protein n=1 Tax=Phytophthora megakarya TaxID=4795 RepID=A0A225X0N5_9STRA|nr:LOW QUALITY PROTEIN: hypothetical protein PHMEG_0002478 [Phytophthora megakarya]
MDWILSLKGWTTLTTNTTSGTWHHADAVSLHINTAYLEALERQESKQGAESIWGQRLKKDFLGEVPTYYASTCASVNFKVTIQRSYLIVTFVRAEDFTDVFACDGTTVNHIVEDDECNYFVQQPDATGRLSFFPEQKVTARVLRKPFPDDLEILLAKETLRADFLSRLYVLDLEELPDGLARPLHLHLYGFGMHSYGMSDANNDLNVLRRSPLLDDVVNGVAPKVYFTVNGVTYDQAYYLRDGIYP